MFTKTILFAHFILLRCQNCRYLRASLGVKISSRILLRVKELTFRNSVFERLVNFVCRPKPYLCDSTQLNQRLNTRPVCQLKLKRKLDFPCVVAFVQNTIYLQEMFFFFTNYTLGQKYLNGFWLKIDTQRRPRDAGIIWQSRDNLDHNVQRLFTIWIHALPQGNRFAKPRKMR